MAARRPIQLWCHWISRKMLTAPGGLILFFSFWIIGALPASTLAPVFSGPEAEYEQAPDSALAKDAPADVLRWIWVEERVGLARKQVPVRTPVFFSNGECRDPDELALKRWPTGEIVPLQVDDLRRGADGNVARLHLWFETDLAAGERQRWALIRRTSTAAASVRSVELVKAGDTLKIQAGGTIANFFVGEGKSGPGLVGLKLADGPALEFHEGTGATTSWSGLTKSDAAVIKREDAAKWSEGVVFAKVSLLKNAGNGHSLEQVWRIFKNGWVNLAQTIQLDVSDLGSTLVSQDFLNGQLTSTEGLVVRPQSAALVDSLVNVHRGYVVDTLRQNGMLNGWLIVPGTLGGTAGRLSINRKGEFQLQAPGNLKRGGDARPSAVRAVWAEVSLIPAKREGEDLSRETLLIAGQPLVGVVERPGITLSLATEKILDNVREMKPVGWANETVIRSLQGKAEPFPRRKFTAESNPETWIADAKKAAGKITGNGARPLREDEKGRAAGSIDPYHITYESTALAHWLLLDEVPPAALDAIRARMEAVRRQLARVDEQGWPYLDVFARTQNMQMGPPLLALADSGADPALRSFYRDQLSNPILSAVQLRGLRPYEGRPQFKPVESDNIYQAVVDFMLRASELGLKESLGFNSVSFGRYLDSIDVNADLYHTAHPRSPDDASHFARANFYRVQSHFHRWLGWGPAPFISLLRAPTQEETATPGATEAWYYANMLIGRWKNWPDQSWLFLSAMLSGKTAAYSPAQRPAAAKITAIERTSAGNRFSWEDAPEAVSYRVYRLRPGSSPVWLNSPYKNTSAAGKRAIEWLDAEGKAGDAYRVHAVDRVGRESAW